jgi:hypothetical protein
MEPRKLKALLTALRAAGVKSYSSGDLTVQFGDTTPQVTGGDVEGADDLMLPEGVPDARTMLNDIEKAYAKAPKRAGARR